MSIHRIDMRGGQHRDLFLRGGICRNAGGVCKHGRVPGIDFWHRERQVSKCVAGGRHYWSP